MDSPQFIPILDWTLLQAEDAKLELRKVYQIPDSYNIVGTDNNGNVLVEFKNKLLKVDHEEPASEPFMLTDNFSLLLNFLMELSQLKECSIDTPLKEIRDAKKKLVELRKTSPPFLKEAIEDELDNLKELISDYQFYKSKEGKRHLLTEEYKKKFYSKLGKPSRYKYIEAEREFETELIKINGICANATETTDEIKEILTTIDPPFTTQIGTIITFEEYQRRLLENQRKKEQ